MAALALGACHESPRPADALVATRRSVDRPDQPLATATRQEIARFQAGDRLFELPFREPDGLGPLFIRASCEACHQADGRGPGLVGKMVVVQQDGVTAAADQSALAYGTTQRPHVAAGARRPLGVPGADTLAQAAAPAVRTTFRLPPAVFGRGYLEAVADSEIERLATRAAGRHDGIRGRINRVRYESEANPGTAVHRHRHGQSGIIGRFGLKARIATLDEFAADALQGDMGLTSPVRPAEPPNPDGLTDDAKPGVDITGDDLNTLADYLRLLEIPHRAGDTDRGRDLFARALCAECHVPALATRTDYPIAALADRQAPVFTDFLLHDMGAQLADGITDASAAPGEWRTAPLIGLRFSPAFMHDGRAKTVEEAVLAHEGPGSEANVAVARFRAFEAAARSELIRFVEGL
ncbi:MAG: di-heme oxidoredictase family protein [Pseudomonadota bacterium]